MPQFGGEREPNPVRGGGLGRPPDLHEQPFDGAGVVVEHILEVLDRVQQEHRLHLGLVEQRGDVADQRGQLDAVQFEQRGMTGQRLSLFDLFEQGNAEEAHDHVGRRRGGTVGHVVEIALDACVSGVGRADRVRRLLHQPDEQAVPQRGRPDLGDVVGEQG